MSSPRLAYLLKKFPRLSETFILGEILSQERMGRDIHVFSRRSPDDEPRHPELAHLKATIENLPHYREIDPWDTLFADDWDAEAVFSKVGRVVREGKTWEHPRFPSLLVEALHLLRRTNELGIQHIHSHFATDSAIVAMILNMLGGPTYSITAHAKDIYRNTVKPELLSKIFENSAFSITVCDANARYLAETIDEKGARQVRRLYNGIDLDSFEFTESGRDEGHVLSIGRLVEKKGFHILFDAAKLLKDKGLAFRLSIVGEGEDREQLLEQIERLGIGDIVTMHGAMDQGQVRVLMGKATVFALPCIIGDDGNRDALPTVLLESLAMGLPCISTPVTGIPEILDNGGCGLIVPEHDVAATAQAIEQLLGDEARRREFSRLGRERAETLFNTKKNAQILFDFFEEALNREGQSCESPT